MSSPDLTAADIEAVTRVLQTPYLSIGPRIAEFEERFAAYVCPEPGRRVGARHAIGVSSGTAGLHLCVIAAGVGEDDSGTWITGRFDSICTLCSKHSSCPSVGRGFTAWMV